MHYHFYVDDAQIYFSFCESAVGEQKYSRSGVELCIKEIEQWMMINKLKLNRAELVETGLTGLCLWYSPVIEWARVFPLAQIALWRVQRVVWFMNYNCARDPFTSELFRVNLLSRNLVQ